MKPKKDHQRRSTGLIVRSRKCSRILVIFSHPGAGFAREEVESPAVVPVSFLPVTFDVTNSDDVRTDIVSAESRRFLMSLQRFCRR